jgi:hypothetical protein
VGYDGGALDPAKTLIQSNSDPSVIWNNAAGQLTPAVPTPTPEPSSFALILAGMGLALALRKLTA